jgi:hypothetical protein
MGIENLEEGVTSFWLQILGHISNYYLQYKIKNYYYFQSYIYVSM